MERFPGKVEFYQYNTGGIGEILEEYMDGETPKKRMIRKVSRVPIDLMAAIQRGDLRGTNRYEKGMLGTEEIISCEGHDLSKYDPHNFYSQEQIDDYIEDIVSGRRKFTDEIASEGLDSRILKYAEKSFSISKKRAKTTVYMPSKESESENVTETAEPGSWTSKRRPPRPFKFI